MSSPSEWTDWVDYWAVDFDYMSRKEIIKVGPGRKHRPPMRPSSSKNAGPAARLTVLEAA